jgi:environmental stress-induced protein Ves
MIGRLLALDAVAPTPWRNGGGLTRELLTWPADAAWNARISVADVDADGPFSSFPGVERWFAVIAGGGVDLDFGDANERMTPDAAPLRFDGARAPMCRLLDGPTRDLNLMLRGARGAMIAAADHRPWSPAGQACAFFAAVDGVVHAPRERERIPAGSLLVCTPPPATLRFAADSDRGSTVGWWLQWSPAGTS